MKRFAQQYVYKDDSSKVAKLFKFIKITESWKKLQKKIKVTNPLPNRLTDGQNIYRIDDHCSDESSQKEFILLS